jgi:hypothetical protein
MAGFNAPIDTYGHGGEVYARLAESIQRPISPALSPIDDELFDLELGQNCL